MKKLLIFSLTLIIGNLLSAQDIEFGEGYFEANFTIDAMHTMDGKTIKLSASGEAGPYGKAYLSYIFTSKQNMADQGEFTGFAWTQIEDQITTGTLQGVWKKQGKVFKMYSYDNATNGKINIVSGVADFTAKTMDFKVSELK